jgi:hypothetical protein
MNSLLIWKKNCRNVPGNDPVAIINFNTASAMVDHWTNTIVENPGKFDIELSSLFTFEESCAVSFYNAIGAVLAGFQQMHDKLENDDVLVSIFCVLQEMSFTVERIEKAKEKENQNNDFDDQFLMNYEE